MSSRALLRMAASALVVLVMLSLSATPLAMVYARADDATGSATTLRAVDYDQDAADAPFPDLSVTVSQTKDLLQQGIKVNWTGAKQSTPPNQQTGGENFLQIAQCWGDEPGSDGTRPDRTTCQYGGFNLPGDTRSSNRASGAVIADEDASYTAKGAGWWQPTMTAIPFVSATGKTLATVLDGKRLDDPADLASNEFYTGYTTNEVSWAGSGADGSGSVSFELQTAQQSPGLGCGNPVTGADGRLSGRACWLVVIPRGGSDVDDANLTQSGLLWQNWKHHVAFRLDFRPVGLHCKIGAVERQLSGSELVSTAMGQWQPKLCNRKGGAIYSLITGPESDAASAANGTEAAPMAVTTRPLTGGTDNLAYAPIALTGLSIAFAVDEQPSADGSVPDEVIARQRQAFTTLKLNARLVAKLLTASYTDAIPNSANKSHLSGVRNLTKDPEFLSINDKEWAYMSIVGVGVSDALETLGRSDAASTLWSYVLSDPNGADFLNGVPDRWGMHVNPYYSSNERVNPTGTGLSYPRDDFPKADPSEYKGSARYNYADVVNLVTWRPFTSSLEAGAYLVLRGDPQSLGVWDDTAVPPKYTRGDRGLVGLQAVLGVTDTGAAAKYQVAQASLLNAAGEYVAPTRSSLKAAAAVMTADSAQAQVLRLDSESSAVQKAKAAYPLTVPVYAAVNPAMNDAALRSDYADFITFAVTDGQQPGTADGQLPDGFVPLPDAWKKAALAAATKIRAGVQSSPTASPSSSPTATVAQPAVPSAPPASPSTTPTPSPTPSVVTPPPTPADPDLGPMTVVVPVTAGVGLVSAAAAPLLPLMRRRRR